MAVGLILAVCRRLRAAAARSEGEGTRMSRILIAGGGTAGHVVPALALADVLAGRGHQVAFCGTERGMEKHLVPRAGYPFSLVRIRGFERKLGLSTVRTLGSIPLAGVDAWKLLRSYKPDCVVGVGAYASGPVVAEAALAGIPAVAVEMDAHMGWTNRILSTVVDRVCLSFPRPEPDQRQVRATPGGPCGPRCSAPLGSRAWRGSTWTRPPGRSWSSAAAWARTR